MALSRGALPLDCRDTPLTLACSACGQYARACELLATVDRICCARCSHPDTRYFWRVQLLVTLELRYGFAILAGLHEQFECLAHHVGHETARAQWLVWRAAVKKGERPKC